MCVCVCVCVCVKELLFNCSVVSDSSTPWTVAQQAPWDFPARIMEWVAIWSNLFDLGPIGTGFGYPHGPSLEFGIINTFKNIQRNKACLELRGKEAEN